MNKLYLVALALLFSFIGRTQHFYHHDDEMYCSKAKFYESYFENLQTIVQTHLLHSYDVKHYFLDINVMNNSTYVDGEVTFLVEVVALQLDTFAFELLDVMTITQVLVNDVSHSFTRLNNEVFVPLTSPIQTGQLFSVKIVYGGTPPTGGFFSGISTALDSWGKHVTWTLSEPFAARDWWPTKQVLADKADSVWVFLTTDQINMAGSNGLLTNVTPMPGNQLRYEWKSNYPIAYYLISFAVSEYQEYNIYAHPAAMGGDSLLIQNFIYDAPGCLDFYKSGIDATVGMVELFSDLFSLYPFHQEKYGHCLTALGGGMEHQTMSTMGGFSFGLVAHELGHMWFGDYVTCATWSDIWINEGFATYSDYLAREMILGPSAAAAMMNSIHNSVMSLPDGSVYIPEEEISYDNIWRIFNGRLSYNKGAALLHMIRFELQDDELFFQVLQTFQAVYADSVATGLDFMLVLNDVSGMDFTQFFDQWYFGEGYPVYSIKWSQDNAYTYFEITQTVSMPQITPVFEMLMAYKLFFYDNTDTTIYLYQTANVNTFMVPISKPIGLIQIDPQNWVLNQAGSITTNIDQTQNQPFFTFWPNPSRDVIHVEFAEALHGIRTIEISDIKGNLLQQINTSEKFIHMNISQLQQGTYLIRVKEPAGSYSRKFIKVE
jgi:aminopeptidase N